MHQANDQQWAEQDAKIKASMDKIKHTLVVMSGKGGVGKSTVAVNLSYALSVSGSAVGILDVDLHGPNIAKMLGIESRCLEMSQWGIMPVEVTGNLKAVSLAVLGDNATRPAIWRGPAKSAVIRQFLSEVRWGDLDYFIIDAPPGTGDEPLSVCQMIPKVSGIVIVTTPQDVATLDARKSIMFAQALKIPVIGLVENMSGWVCPHCHAETALFKKGGGKALAEELAIPFLGAVPLSAELVECGDKGIPFVAAECRSAAVKPFEEIVAAIKRQLGG